MKLKVSVSMDEELIGQVDEILEEGLFRNKSHFIEYAVKRFIKRGENDF